MRKTILTVSFIFIFIFTAFSQQISKNALGLRLGDSDGFGAEISYQRGLMDNNRLEFGLGWRDADDYNAFRLTGLYQWVFPLDGNFNWYVGAGGGFGNIDPDDNNLLTEDLDSEFFAFVAGDIGIEYNFDIPLLISLDFRPEIGFNDYTDDFDFDIALGIRYQF
jgi:opacity protein-like surface antigen